MSAGLTSLVSAVSDPAAVDLIDDLRQAGVDLEFVDGPWEARLAALRDGEAQVGWLCGLLHVMLQAQGDWPFEAVAAPRSTRPDVLGMPVYFGDVVVRGDSPHTVFGDLEGGVFAYNEESSLSGYHMMRDQLAMMGTDLTFFGETLRSGSHLESAALVAGGTADCAIIDSTLMDAAIPGTDRLRTLVSVGPYPAPPIVTTHAEAAALRAALDEHTDWAPVSDDAYTGLHRLR